MCNYLKPLWQYEKLHIVLLSNLLDSFCWQTPHISNHFLVFLYFCVCFFFMVLIVLYSFLWSTLHTFVFLIFFFGFVFRWAPTSIAPYLRNRTSSNHNFLYTCVKWSYIQPFFHFFEILIFWVVMGVKGQKIAQPKIKNNNYIRHASYLRNSIAYNHGFWYTCVKWWYLHGFFSFCWYFHFLGY